MNSGRRDIGNWRERRCRVRNWRGSRSRDAFALAGVEPGVLARRSRTRRGGRARAPIAPPFGCGSRRWLHALQDFGFAQGMVARLRTFVDALDYFVVRRKPAALQPEKNI